MRKVCATILEQIMREPDDPGNALLNMDVWDWSQGVALYGIWKYHQLTGDKTCLAYLTRWFDGKLHAPAVRNVNTTAPLLTLCCLYEETGNRQYLDFCLAWGDWVLHTMPKTEMGGIQHVTIDSENVQQMWADTVFMTVLFLAKLGAVSRQKRFTDEASRQLMLHIRFLADLKTGLWYHGWSFLRRDHFAGAFWARGNCWFTIAAAELEELAQVDGWVRDMVLDAYRMQAASLRFMQAPEGLWHTLLDHPDSYLETSGSAGFAYGMLRGVRLGYLDASFRDAAARAAHAVLRQVGADGAVRGVSYGTIVAEDLAYYKHVELRPAGYGQALALLLLVEMIRWEDRL